MIDRNKNHGEIAEELFRGGFNCAQAVVAAFEDVTGFDRDTSVKVSAAFGGGMCRMREVCGAVSGAMLVLGAVYGEDTQTDHAKKTELYRIGQDFADSIKEELGSLVCRELLGLSDGKSDAVPEARTDAYYKKRPCAEIVRISAEILEKIIK